MTSCALGQQKLALNILGEHFGDIVKVVAQALLRVDKAMLGDIIRRVRREIEDGRRRGPGPPLQISGKQVKSALLVLCQHNCLDVIMQTAEELRRSKVDGPLKLYYKLRVSECIERLRGPRFVHLASVMHGALAAAVVEALLLHGRLCRADVVAHVVNVLKADKQGYMDENALRRRIERAFDTLVQERFIVKVAPLDLTRPSPPPTTGAQLKKMMDFSLPANARGRGKPGAGGGGGAAGGEGGETGPPVAVRKRKRVAQQPLDEDEDALPMEMQMMLDNARMLSGQGQLFDGGTSGGAAELRARQYDEDEAEFEDLPAAKRPRGGSRAATRGGRGRGRGRGGKAIPAAGDAAAAPAEAAAAAAAAAPPAAAALAPAQAIGSAERSISETQSSTVWRVGHDQFHRVLRHALCLKLVRDSMGNKLAQDIMVELMKLAAPMERSAHDSHSTPVAFIDLLRAMTTPLPNNARLYRVGVGAPPSLPTAQTLRVFLQHFASGKMASVTEVVDKGEGAKFVINYANMIAFAQQRALHTFIADKYDVPTARITRILLEKRYMEQQGITDEALLPQKETRSKLYTLYHDHLVSMQEVPRTASHEPKTTTYLWTVRPALMTATMVDNIEKALLNVRLRRQHLYATNRHYIEHADKFNTMETKHRAKLVGSLQRLSMAQLKLDETLMLFRTF